MTAKPTFHLNARVCLVPIAILLMAAATRTASAVVATGGSMTNNGTYVIHTFTNAGTTNFTVAVAGNVDVLVVAGGGGGGSVIAGGGGAGGLLYSSSFAVSTGATTVIVGLGGLGAPSGNWIQGSVGTNSSFGALIAYGGGGGGGYNTSPGLPGGSGGGGGNSSAGGTNSPSGQGKAGGTASSGNAGGGGGGAGSAGTNATSAIAGMGGAGISNGISGMGVYYAGGGGGGARSGNATASAGGIGGGGMGAASSLGGSNGVANTGGGGGGGGFSGSWGQAGGNGGSGIVIVRYASPTIANLAASNVTLSSAFFNGNLLSTSAVPTSVFVYWGTNDGGTVASAWGNTNQFPDYQPLGVLTTNVTGLSSNITYYYAFCSMNSAGTNWAWPSSLFLPGQVALVATTPNASEIGLVPGTFSVSRPPTATNVNLVVYYTLGGTASNGQDYAALNGVVTIPAGQTNAAITVLPIWDQFTAGSQTVQAALAPGPYLIGAQSSDVVTIADYASPLGWSGTNNWNVANNWSGGVLPGMGDGVVISNGTVVLSNTPPQLSYIIITNATLVFTNYNTNTMIWLQASNVFVRNSGTITHSPNSAVSTNSAGQWVPDARVYILCTNLAVDLGGTIDVTGKGYAGGGAHTNGFGPGGGFGNQQCGLAGGYGGLGGNGGNGSRVQGATYGSVTLPADPGSGGGGGDGSGGASGNGGGAVWLVAAGNATVNGTIIADGTGPNTASYQGGGSGGGVYLKAQSLLGAGSIMSRGGNGNQGYSSGGGGGRIGLDLGDAANWAGRIELTRGWTGSSQGAGMLPAQVGTLYATNVSLLSQTFTNQWRLFGVTAWTPGQLTVSSNAYLSFEDTALNLTVASNMTVTIGSYLGLGAGMLTNAGSLSVGGNLIVQGSSTLAVGSTNALTNAVTFAVAGNVTVQGSSALSIGVTNVLPQAATLTVGGDMTLSNGASLSVYAGLSNAATYYGALVTVTGTITVATNSWIYPYSQSTNGGSPTFRMRDVAILSGAGFNADARGFGGGVAQGYGPGAGKKVGSMASGASYGGVGGTGYWTTVQSSPTNTYGSMTAPSDPGSGGAWYNAGVGCAGGGLVRIEAQGDVTLNGTITADGGVSPNTDYKSSGSGGGIYVTCRFLKGAQGTLCATGGATGAASQTFLPGAGGGGRIAVWSALVQATTGTWTISANGGTAPLAVSAGSSGTIFFARSPTPPLITNTAASSVSFFSATLNGTLISTGTAPSYVSVYWGPTDQTTNKTLWANTNVFIGAQAEGTTLTTNVTGLISGGTYYYRYYASNSLGEAWASPAQSFTTIAGVPVISNAVTGATGVTLTSATLNGNLVSAGTAATSLKVFWGPTDGGTTWGAWANTNSFAGTQSAGLWSTNVSLGSSNIYYYYTFYATNSGGDVWASPSVPFIAAGVTLTATQPNARENGANNTGAFAVYRPAAVTNLPLAVNYAIDGTAGNGVDYQPLSGSVVIPAGATSNTITITPIMDGVFDSPDKWVRLTVAPGAYVIGAPSNGTVTIQDVAPSAVNTWTGTGVWTSAANWSDAIPPLPGQRAVIQGNVTLATNTAALGPVTVLTNSTLIFSGTNGVLTATDVTISGTVTHVANSAITTNQFGQWVADGRVTIVCTNLTIAAGGKIDVIGKGYGGGGNHTNGFGPGAGLFFNVGQGAGGGGYGGRGGLWTTLPTQSVAYGSAALPVDPGSGGGGDTSFSGGAGGGAVWLAVAANATVNGPIFADGAAGGDGSGGGSGGGVYLSAQTLQGNSSITAKGGNGTASYGSGGGGGRIAVWVGDASGWVGRIDVSLGSTVMGNSPTLAQLGTVYASSTSLIGQSFSNQQWRLYGVTAWSPSQLTVSSNAYLSFEEPVLTLAVSSNMTISSGSYVGFGSGLLTNASLTVTGNLSVLGSSSLSLGNTNMPLAATLTVGGDMLLSNSASFNVYSAPTNSINTNYFGSLVSVGGSFLLASNSWVYPYSHVTNGGSPTFRVQNLTIMTNAGFNANGAGYAGAANAGFGPGAGIKVSGTAPGASHGGLGGQGYWSGYYGTVAPTNGSMQTPSGPGSGACGYNAVEGPDGNGGGLVRIEASRKVTINGTITANGTAYPTTFVGGGSGGAIYIRCLILAGDTAILSANGGSCGRRSNFIGGGGGGGRIAIWRGRGPDNTNTWSITVSGGAGTVDYPLVAGADGTIFWGSVSPPGTVFLMQ